MNGIIGEYRIGEDIAVALDASAGDPATVTAISARMKPAQVSTSRLVLDEAAAAIDLTVAPQSPASAGWTISLPAAQSAALSPGIYGIDARLAIGAGVEMTDQSAFISLTKAAVA
jgi:hypothetical protein